MNSAKKYKVVFGLGKTGFSCVRHLVNQGYDVAVVDNRTNPPYLKKLQQEYPSVPYTVGSFNSPLLEIVEELVVSPGVSLAEPAITLCLERGAKAIGDVELFLRATNKPIVAITGSNGKSTVTSLVGEMAKACGVKARVGGNLGTPVLDFLNLPNDDDIDDAKAGNDEAIASSHVGSDVVFDKMVYGAASSYHKIFDTAELYVLELSSFQLETVYSLHAAAATVLNITPDHMDRYRDFDDYCRAKWRIYNGCKVAVINRDDAASCGMAEVPEKIISFGLDAPQKGEFGFIDESLFYGKKKLLRTDELKMKGLHQAANVLAALALGKAINLPFKPMLDVARNFTGLPHRCQLVNNINGVFWYNDSKGTNVGATKAAIEGLAAGIEGKLVLIAGGVGKNAAFSLLRGVVSKYVKAIILIGKDASLLEDALRGCCILKHAKTMHNAVMMAAHEAVSGDAVLLSPACASFDMFDNFEHRGQVFMDEVRKFSRKG